MRITLIFLATALVAACSSDSATISGADALADTTPPPADTGQDVAPPDLTPQEEVVDTLDLPTPDATPLDLLPDFATPQCRPGEGCFLDKCIENNQCQSGWCVEHMGEGVCTQMCQDECPAGWTCKQLAGADPDVVFVCASNVANLCKPCNGPADCKSPGGVDDACVDYGPAGAFCGAACDLENGCPWGFTCKPTTTVSGTPTTQCVNDAGVCPCTDRSTALGLWTDCKTSNEFGVCPGKRVCTEEGLADCDANEALAETCNGQDDDCDGETDEPALVEGDYVNLCNDDNPCTGDTCVGQEGCINQAVQQGTCDDLDPCTVADHCEEGACTGDQVLCNDDNPCTQDLCTPTGGCDHPPATGKCDDLDPCTLADQCENGQCAGTPVNCDCNQDNDCDDLEDANLCNGTLLCDTLQVPHKCVVDPQTVVECDPPQGDFPFCIQSVCETETGDCLTVPANQGLVCDNADPCTVDDTCDDGLCAAGNPINCNDGNPCTADSCQSGVGCQYENLDVPCNDGDVCTVADLCEDGQCKGGEQLQCDDDNVCTDDTCDPQTGCQHATNQAPCDDNDLCTVGDVCSAGQCVHTGTQDCNDGNPCTADSCQPGKGCLHEAASGTCDDNDPCTINDVCQMGKCVGGKKLVCNDGNACTDEVCGPDGECIFTPNDAACDDQNMCTSGDHCELGFCVHTLVDTCGDDNVCTDTWCDPVQGCVSQFNNSPCDDGDQCTLGDLCAQGQCQGAQTLECDDANLCTDDVCQPGVGCVFTPNSEPCDDGNQCTVGEQCQAGWCKGGAGAVCNDGNICTDDSCDPQVGCVFTANENPCNDGDFCTVGDACDQTVCQPGPDVPCNDGQFCNGEESCNPDVGCVAGVPPVLDDQTACTVDSCDENTDQVLHLPDHDACPEGTLCQHGVCDPEQDGCVLETIPDCCGNNIVEDGEECDDANLDDNDACVSCFDAVCGDGFLQEGEEDCEATLPLDATCEEIVGEGFTGQLACDGDCNFDTSDCTGPLGSQTNPAPTCLAILDAGESTGNGVYHLAYDGGAIQAYCDMDNGGWTLITSWQYQHTPGPWGEFHVAVDDPAPGKHHCLPFKALFPQPDRVKMTYLGNNQTLEFDITDGQTWSKANNGTRVQVTTGNYLIFENLHCEPGQGVCVVNGNYHDNHNCDGDSGQIGGQGWFNHCTGNEFCNCGTFGWKYDSGGCSATVCDPTAQLAVYLK